MAVRMVSRFYLTYSDAVQAVADLVAAGVPDTDISLIESEGDARLPPDVATDDAQSPASTGAKLGAGIGGGFGMLVGVGAVGIPGVDVDVIGWFPPILAGVVIGALLGAGIGKVTRLGVTNRQAHSFAEGLQRGEILVMVRVEEAHVPQIEEIMARNHAPLPPQVEPPEPPTNLAEVHAQIERDEKRIRLTSE